MTTTSGRNLVGSWTSCGPLGSLERTLLGTSAWASTTCYLTWKDKATPAGRLLFQLAPSVPRTAEIASGPSPHAAMWPTPKSTSGGPSNLSGLEIKGEMAPTAYRDGQKIQVNLVTAVNWGLSPTGQSQIGSLNPTWVEWLMGFPSGWTDLKPSETP